MTYGGQGFKVRVGVVLLHPDGQQVLLARQNGRPFWVLPGGTLEHEPAETLQDCAIRELQEEAGLAIAINRLLYVGDFMAPGLKRSLDIVFLASLANGCNPEDLRMSRDENLDAMEWMLLQDLPTLALQPVPVFQQIMQKRWQDTPTAPVYLGGYAP